MLPEPAPAAIDQPVPTAKPSAGGAGSSFVPFAPSPPANTNTNTSTSTSTACGSTLPPTGTATRFAWIAADGHGTAPHDTTRLDETKESNPIESNRITAELTVRPSVCLAGEPRQQPQQTI
mmetsp:Transcript_11862/g.24142  ORF Transcript_11862/g.24142 Transcript_11862/m.24142 type:complete len:121 (-) Transcript_11862:117-479(-)